MMKITSPLKAALLGSVATLATMLLLSAGPVVSQLLRVAIANEVEVALSPHPRDAIRIHEGTPLTVPTGKLLIITAFGRTVMGGNSANTYLLIDGVYEATTASHPASVGTGPAVTPSMQEAPPGLVATAGQVVSTDDGNLNTQSAVAWGYLVDA